MRNGDIVLNILEDCDDNYYLLEKWYQIEDIYNNFEQRTLNFNEIKEKYKTRTSELYSINLLVKRTKNCMN